MTTWFVVLAAAAGTYLLRISMVVAFAGRTLSPGLEARLRLIAPSVLAAVVATALFTSTATQAGGGGVELVAVVAAAIVVRRTGRPVHALVVGLPVAWALSAVG